MDDPAFVANLLDQSLAHSCYFSIGNPIHGNVERIGVVPDMLMAHSMVLRNALSLGESEADEMHDIPLFDTTPETFKNMLRFVYGYNNLHFLSIPECVALLKLAECLVMQPMMVEVVRHITLSLNPQNLCLVFQEALCLKVNILTEEIDKVLKTKIQALLACPLFYDICPAAMHYIVMFNGLKVSRVVLWRAVVKWARKKVLDEEPDNTTRLESLVHQKLITPQYQHIQMCMLNLINLAKNVHSGRFPRDQLLDSVSNYHFAPNNPSRETFVCTESHKGTYVVHQRFSVVVVHDCCDWTTSALMPKSQLILTTVGSCVELYSIICMGNRNQIEAGRDLRLAQQMTSNQSIYQCQYTVKIYSIDMAQQSESLITTVTGKDNIMYKEEFEVVLMAENVIHLHRGAMFRIDIEFKESHPLWYSPDSVPCELDNVNPEKGIDLLIECGRVGQETLLYGSHVKYILYRPVKDETLSRE